MLPLRKAGCGRQQHQVLPTKAGLLQAYQPRLNTCAEDPKVQHPQLTLPLGIVPSSSFESFLPGKANLNAFATIKALCSGELNEQQLLLWGDRSVGKTHLLSAACANFTAKGYQVAYLTGALANHADALHGLESFELVCVDDLHLLHTTSEEALFHFINRCRESQTRMIFASRNSIDNMGYGLPDLLTRLSWGPVFQLQTLDDNELSTVLVHMFKLRGLEVGDDVIEYVLRRYPRDISVLKQLVDQLDSASLREQRRITIPLIKSFSAETA